MAISEEEKKKRKAEYNKKYKTKNAEKIKAQRLAHFKKNKESINQKAVEKTKQVKLEVMKHYSQVLSNSTIPCCNCCGENHLVFLTIDHIEGWKNLDEPDLSHRSGNKRLVGKELYRHIRNNDFPDGYQVLCRNCNSAKSDEGQCPHERNN